MYLLKRLQILEQDCFLLYMTLLFRKLMLSNYSLPLGKLRTSIASISADELSSPLNHIFYQKV